jgi:hypothetical protein
MSARERYFGSRALSFFRHLWRSIGAAWVNLLVWG